MRHGHFIKHKEANFNFIMDYSKHEPLSSLFFNILQSQSSNIQMDHSAKKRKEFCRAAMLLASTYSCAVSEV